MEESVSSEFQLIFSKSVAFSLGMRGSLQDNGTPYFFPDSKSSKSRLSNEVSFILKGGRKKHTIVAKS